MQLPDLASALPYRLGPGRYALGQYGHLGPVAQAAQAAQVAPAQLALAPGTLVVPSSSLARAGMSGAGGASGFEGKMRKRNGGEFDFVSLPDTLQDLDSLDVFNDMDALRAMELMADLTRADQVVKDRLDQVIRTKLKVHAAWSACGVTFLYHFPIT